MRQVMGQEVIVQVHPREGKYLTLDDLERSVESAKRMKMSGGSLIFTGATALRGNVRYLELKDKS
jgi:hypothetical protein